VCVKLSIACITSASESKLAGRDSIKEDGRTDKKKRDEKVLLDEEKQTAFSPIVGHYTRKVSVRGPFAYSVRTRSIRGSPGKRRRLRLEEAPGAAQAVSTRAESTPGARGPRVNSDPGQVQSLGPGMVQPGMVQGIAGEWKGRVQGMGQGIAGDGAACDG
jgi:hypothetical protein